MAAIGLAAALAGACSVAPRTEDATMIDTITIANSVKCEFRDAVRGQFLGAIAEFKGTRPYDNEAFETIVRDRSFAGLDRRRLAPETQRRLAALDRAVVTLDFTFDIKEENNANGGMGIGIPLARGPLSVSGAATFNRQRGTLTNFRTQEDFHTLAFVVTDGFCDMRKRGERELPPPPRPGPNPVHPITGELGVAKQVREFANLGYFEGLDVRPGGPAGVPSASTTYTFLTRLVASAEAAAKLELIGPATQVNSLSAKTELVRQDQHQLIAILSLPPAGPNGKADIASRRIAADAGSREVDRQLVIRSLLTSERQERALDRLARCGAIQLLTLCN